MQLYIQMKNKQVCIKTQSKLENQKFIQKLKKKKKIANMMNLMDTWLLISYSQQSNKWNTNNNQTGRHSILWMH